MKKKATKVKAKKPAKAPVHDAPKPKVKQPRLFPQSKADAALEEAAQALFEAQNEFSAAGKKKKGAESILVERMKKHNRRVMQVGNYTISAIPETKVKVVKKADEDDEEEHAPKKRTGKRYGGEKDESAEMKDSKERKDQAAAPVKLADHLDDAPEPAGAAAADIPSP